MDCQSTSMAWGETKPLPRQCDSRVAWKEFQFYNDACDGTLACDDEKIDITFLNKMKTQNNLVTPYVSELIRR